MLKINNEFVSGIVEISDFTAATYYVSCTVKSNEELKIETEGDSFLIKVKEIINKDLSKQEIFTLNIGFLPSNIYFYKLKLKNKVSNKVLVIEDDPLVFSEEKCVDKDLKDIIKIIPLKKPLLLKIKEFLWFT